MHSKNGSALSSIAPFSRLGQLGLNFSPRSQVKTGCFVPMIAYDQQSRLKSAIAGLFNSSSGSWLDRKLFLSLILRKVKTKLTKLRPTGEKYLASL